MRSLFLPGAVVMAVIVNGCGGGGGPASPSGGSNAVTITIMRQNGNQSFSPNPSSAGGRMVVFRNADTVAHRVILNDGAIDTGDIAAGATSQPVQIPSAGTNYHCSLHPTMVGAVNAAGGEPPPPCTGDYCGGPGGTY